MCHQESTHLLSRSLTCLPLVVKHILLECLNFSDVHQKYFSVSSLMKDLFDNVNVCIVVAFIKETHFHYRL